MKHTENNLIDKEARIIKFKVLFKEVFTEERCDELCEALDKLHFFSAPASTQYHGNYGGGLFDHSYEVTMALLQLTRQLNLTWERPESPYIVGMLHDLCKADCYAYNTKDKVWRHKKELTLTGHGEKSVIRAQQLMNLTEEEINRFSILNKNLEIINEDFKTSNRLVTLLYTGPLMTIIFL